jgi:hypothetical protein
MGACDWCVPYPEGETPATVTTIKPFWENIIPIEESKVGDESNDRASSKESFSVMAQSHNVIYAFALIGALSLVYYGSKQAYKVLFPQGYSLVKMFQAEPEV